MYYNIIKNNENVFLIITVIKNYIFFQYKFYNFLFIFITIKNGDICVSLILK